MTLGISGITVIAGTTVIAVIAAITSALEEIITSLRALPQNFGLILTDVTLKATLLLALTALTVGLSRRASAAWRHLLWMLGLSTALGLPILIGAVPHLTVSLPKTTPAVSAIVSITSAWQAAPSGAMLPAAPKAETVLSAAAATDTTPQAETGQTRAEVTLPAGTVRAVIPVPLVRVVPVVLLLAWLVGVGVVLTQWLAGTVGLGRILAATVKVTGDGDGAIASAYRAADRALMGRRRPVSLRVALSADTVRTPLTWGWRQPVIALPLGADAWPEARLRAALLHELAHIQRRDWPLQRLAHIACALYWFHPLVWIAARAARAESEKASDDLVLTAGLHAAAYADHLLDVARALCPSSRSGASGGGWGAVAMVLPRMSGIEVRLRAVLALNRSRGALSSRRITVAVLAALLVALPVAALQPVAQTQGGKGTTPTLPVTVIVDAGHGGADNGATAKNVKEKDINLAVARRLRDLLTSDGIWVVMTRSEDTYKAVGDRGAVAAREKAACFISVHCEMKAADYRVLYHDKNLRGLTLASYIARQNARAFGRASGKAASDTVRFPSGLGVLRKSSPVSAAVMVNCPDVARMNSPKAQIQTARAIAAGVRDFVRTTAK